MRKTRIDLPVKVRARMKVYPLDLAAGLDHVDAPAFRAAWLMEAHVQAER